MMTFSRYALTVLALSASRVLAITNYDISVGTTPVVVNGFNEASNAAEMTMSFTLADGAAVTAANIACAAYDIAAGSPNQCNTAASLSTQIATTPTLTVNALSVAININLEAIGPSGGYSYDAATKVGTLEFCTQCVTSDPTSGAIDYAEIMSTVTITMEETIPTITANVDETDQTEDILNAGVAGYAVTAEQCVEGTHATDTAVLKQGDYVNFCVKFALAGVDCLYYESLTMGSFTVVAAGDIDNDAITTGNDFTTKSTDTVCAIKTQFPSSLIPADGTAATVNVDGSVVLEFQNRRLRVKLSELDSVSRALESGKAIQDIPSFGVELRRSDEQPIVVSSGTASIKAGLSIVVGAFLSFLLA